MWIFRGNSGNGAGIKGSGAGVAVQPFLVPIIAVEGLQAAYLGPRFPPRTDEQADDHGDPAQPDDAACGHRPEGESLQGIVKPAPLPPAELKQHREQSEGREEPQAEGETAVV